MLPSSGLLDPKTLARLESLELIARTVVEGFLRGLHRGAHKGSSAEFAEHRPYVPGDEIARIDWRSYAKTDRYFVKEYEDETNLRATLVLDASASMAYGSQGLTKLRYAQCLAAAIGYFLARQLDAVGLVVADSTVRRRLAPRAHTAHTTGLIGEIERALPLGATALARVLSALAGEARRRGLAVVFSDLFDDPRALLKALASFRHRRWEVVVFQILDPEEKDFPFTSWTVFRDVEAPSYSVRLDARQMRALYLKNFREHQELLRAGCASLEVGLVPLDTRTPFEEALERFLLSRKRRGG